MLSDLSAWTVLFLALCAGFGWQLGQLVYRVGALVLTDGVTAFAESYRATRDRQRLEAMSRARGVRQVGDVDERPIDAPTHGDEPASLAEDAEERRSGRPLRVVQEPSGPSVYDASGLRSRH